MKKFGIELEFFVKDIEKDKIIPAYIVTKNLDGDPVIGELKTEVHDDIYSLIYELKSLIHKEKDDLKKRNCIFLLNPEVIFTNDDYKSLRRDNAYVNNKELNSLNEKSIYNKKTSKILSRTTFRAGLQVNISENSVKTIKTENNIYKDIYSSNVFDFYSIIRNLDSNFKEEINNSKRINGVYSIKNGEYGNRVEYRSLPNSICLNKLLDILLKIK